MKRVVMIDVQTLKILTHYAINECQPKQADIIKQYRAAADKAREVLIDAGVWTRK